MEGPRQSGIHLGLLSVVGAFLRFISKARLVVGLLLPERRFRLDHRPHLLADGAGRLVASGHGFGDASLQTDVREPAYDLVERSLDQASESC